MWEGLDASVRRLQGGRIPHTSMGSPATGRAEPQILSGTDMPFGRQPLVDMIRARVVQTHRQGATAGRLARAQGKSLSKLLFGGVS